MPDRIVDIEMKWLVFDDWMEGLLNLREVLQSKNMAERPARQYADNLVQTLVSYSKEHTSEGFAASTV